MSHRHSALTAPLGHVGNHEDVTLIDGKWSPCTKISRFAHGLRSCGPLAGVQLPPSGPGTTFSASQFAHGRWDLTLLIGGVGGGGK